MCLEGKNHLGTHQCKNLEFTKMIFSLTCSEDTMKVKELHHTVTIGWQLQPHWNKHINIRQLI